MCRPRRLSESMSFFVTVELRVLDTEANKFFDRNHPLYVAALCTRCYTQHALRLVIDSETNHKRYFDKLDPLEARTTSKKKQTRFY